MCYITINERNKKIEKVQKMGTFKPNTTINIPVEVLERARAFIIQTPEIKSRNVLIEKALTHFMDHWEEIKKAA